MGMGLLLAAAALVVLTVVAMRFGVDSRERSPSGWFARPRKSRKDIGTA